jgi:hypothetical protein
MHPMNMDKLKTYESFKDETGNLDESKVVDHAVETTMEHIGKTIHELSSLEARLAYAHALHKKMLAHIDSLEN